MNKKLGFFSFLLVSLIYLSVFVFLDSKNDLKSIMPKISSMLFFLSFFSLLTFGIRYIRFYMLLKKCGNSFHFISGFFCYLTGFAFTATPGKVGELLRMRYFTKLGVKNENVFSAFVFERAFDLIVALLLATLVVTDLTVYYLALTFVFVFISLVITLCLYPRPLILLNDYSKRTHFYKISSILDALSKGLQGCRIWFNFPMILTSFFLGLFSWGILSFSFYWFLNQLNISLPLFVSFSIYPLAMLAGAASMLPGGMGSTEAAIVYLLAHHAVPYETAILAAVGIRVATIWFSMALGFCAIGLLEVKNKFTYSNKPLIR